MADRRARDQPLLEAEQQDFKLAFDSVRTASVHLRKSRFFSTVFVGLVKQNLVPSGVRC